MNETGRSRTDREAAWRTSTVILLSLPIGVSLLAAVGLWLRTRGDAAPTGEPGTLVTVWLLLTIGTLAAAWIAWQRRVAPLLPGSPARGDPPSPGEVARMQSGLIVCMALLEGAALFGGVLLILGAGPAPALVGVVIMWTAFFLLRPRREWFGLR